MKLKQLLKLIKNERTNVVIYKEIITLDVEPIYDDPVYDGTASEYKGKDMEVLSVMASDYNERELVIICK